MDDSRARKAAELLAAFFDEEKMRRGGRFAEFSASWKYLVGERLAAHSRVSDVEKGILVVEADHPGWIQLLQLRQAEILEGIGRRFPELGLRSIVFRLARGGAVYGSGPARGEAEPGEATRPGPFGPGGRPPAEPEAEAEEGARGEDLAPENLATQAPKPAALADPAFRSLFEDLKKAVDGKE